MNFIVMITTKNTSVYVNVTIISMTAIVTQTFDFGTNVYDTCVVIVYK